jgi:acyl-coenzyme A synthetase/AMP-(fatty) acid ligase
VREDDSHALPLLRARGAQAVFAHRGALTISVDRFLGDVVSLAERLPDRRHLLNLCSDRYHFAVGFSAALLKCQINLLPPNQTPDLLQRLGARYPDTYCLTDDAMTGGLLERTAYPVTTGTGVMAASIPFLPVNQVAALAFTSGSTGDPVPHEKSWGALAGSTRLALDRLRTQAFPGMAVLGTVPPQHMYGLESTVLLPMQGGLVLQAGRPFYPAEVLAALAALPRPRCLVTTPIHLQALLGESGGFPTVDLMVCATAPLTPALAREAEARFATEVQEIYGCTEAGQIATRRTAVTAEWSPFAGVRLREDPHGTWVAGDHLETDVLLHDVIELRGPSRFLLHGRTADLVNIAGKRTSLANLNFHLNAITGVQDGVFVMPEGTDGPTTRLSAYVVAPGLTPAAVMSALRQRIDAAFLPRPLCFVESLPRNALGKLSQQALHGLLTARAAAAARS